MRYCDTNVLTAFVNRGQLGRTFGDEGFERFKNHIKGQREIKSERKLRRINKCIIDRDALLGDIGYHKASVGAVLTATNLRNIQVKKINGLEEGEKVFNKACSSVNKETHFHKKFCKRNSLRKDLDNNNLNDVKHFGSAIKSNSNIFLTENKKDFEPVIKFTNIKLEGI